MSRHPGGDFSFLPGPQVLSHHLHTAFPATLFAGTLFRPDGLNSSMPEPSSELPRSQNPWSPDCPRLGPLPRLAARGLLLVQTLACLIACGPLWSHLLTPSSPHPTLLLSSGIHTLCLWGPRFPASLSHPTSLWTPLSHRFCCYVPSVKMWGAF